MGKTNRSGESETQVRLNELRELGNEPPPPMSRAKRPEHLTKRQANRTPENAKRMP